MKKALIEIISYSGYTIIIYYLCRYVDTENIDNTYRLFALLFIAFTIFLFGNNLKEVIKEVSKCTVILIITAIIDFCFTSNVNSIRDTVSIFSHQIIWQFLSFMLIVINCNSYKLHGRYTFRLNIMLLVYLALVVFVWKLDIIIGWIVAVVIFLFLGLGNGYKYYLCSIQEEIKREKEKCDMEQEKIIKERQQKEYIFNLEQENSNLKNQLRFAEQKLKLIKTKKKRRKKKRKK